MITLVKEQFDLFTTLLFIQSNKRLKGIFVQKFDDDFKKHFLLLKSNILSDDVKEFVESLFDEIILADDRLIEEYSNLIKKSKVERYKKSPRRIPKSEILKNAKERGSMTECERAMLAGYELRDLAVRIHNNCKTNKLDDEDARIVIATVDTAKKKLSPIFNRFRKSRKSCGKSS